MIHLAACEHGHHCMTMTAHCNPASCLHRYEAFHVFKIFVANPRKPSSVLALLERNKQRLLQFFGTFLTQREAQDHNFRDEKAFLIEEVHKL